MQEGITQFADVILPLYLPRVLTYALPDRIVNDVKIGSRILVTVKRKQYAGIVVHLHQNIPLDYIPKTALDIIDFLPILASHQLEFWKWLADYYCCTIGEIMIAALPVALKLNSESILVMVEGAETEIEKLDHAEFIVAQALKLNKTLKYSQLEKITGKSNNQTIVQKLLTNGIVTMEEELNLNKNIKPPKFLSLSEQYNNDDALEKLINGWKNAPAQLHVILSYLHCRQTEVAVNRKSLLAMAKVSPAVLNTIISKGILQYSKQEIPIFKETETVGINPPQLANSQKIALESIQSNFKNYPVNLLFGVTGSGKTIVYAHLLAIELKLGKSCLYLLPEIALTSQVVRKLQNYLQGNAVVYHSKLNNTEKLQIWNAVASKRPMVVVGPRSALFLPFQNLGLVIVDEEHDANFKQIEPPPRFHARDAAIVLGKLSKAQVLLGSATPSFESMYNAKTGKYGLTVLSERFGEIAMPTISILNAPKVKSEATKIAIFSSETIQEMESTILNKKQIIVFQNKRGFAPIYKCNTCGWIPKCMHCDVTLTFHKNIQTLECHYCGTKYSVTKNCLNCNGVDFSDKFYGTEQLEENLRSIFPETRIARMDTDSIKGKTAHDKLIKLFEDQKIQILIGTQMVVKGLDFDHVELVVIPDGDGIFRFADFRATERGFQLVQQVSGRAGRKHSAGKVFMQLSNTNYPLLQWVLKHDYESFYNYELSQREYFFYPPYSRIFRIELRHKDATICKKAAEELAINIRKKYNTQLLGPSQPHVSKIRNYYRFELLLKLPKNQSKLSEAKLYIQTCINLLSENLNFKAVRTIIDVDPQ